MKPHEQEKLERLVSNALRDLPSRRAPSSLEMRVQAEIARRAALPWWRKSFAYWPAAARATFVAASVGAVALVFVAFSHVTSTVNTTAVQNTFATDLHWIQVARSLLDTIIQSAAAVIGSISPIWLYGGAATIAALYVALFGLGAAAYRTLYASR